MIDRTDLLIAEEFTKLVVERDKDGASPGLAASIDELDLTRSKALQGYHKRIRATR